MHHHLKHRDRVSAARTRPTNLALVRAVFRGVFFFSNYCAIFSAFPAAVFKIFPRGLPVATLI